MAPSFTIDHTSPATYLDNSGQPVSGFLVEVTLVKWGEGHRFNVPSLEPTGIAKRVQELIAHRDALDKLGA